MSSTGNGGHGSYPYFASKHAVVKKYEFIQANENQNDNKTNIHPAQFASIHAVVKQF